ncbi:Protein of unknown function DUF1376 [uncultured Caudovirales phage]|uniref:DUF1376 domain-containing protein n=1 Tax=uncultured Caudovirales phage TaxID=2100421 RepID=A0A6J5N6G2_9CAUD|nr:Protein of unknown function DUF1376 [uncultured Caudovirales phage]
MSKKTDTWMPLYVTDYLGDTMHLTTEQHGAYMLMLMASWKTNGVLPSDDDSLGAITRLGTAWKKSRKVLLAFFQVDGETMTHKRVLIELQRAKTLNEARSEAGKKAMANRWQKEQQTPLQNDNSVIAKPLTKEQQTPLQNDIPSPSPIQSIPNGIDMDSAAKPRRASKKCPAEFVIDEKLIAWALGENITIDLDAQTRKFRDHTFKDSKTDWHGTWRNWMRRAQDFANESRLKTTATGGKYAAAAAAIFDDGFSIQQPKNVRRGEVFDV